MALIVKVGSKERFLKKMHDRVLKMQNNFEEYKILIISFIDPHADTHIQADYKLSYFAEIVSPNFLWFSLTKEK